jgi:hypothetical protein
MAAIRTALQIGCFGDFASALTIYSVSLASLDGATDEIASVFVADSTDSITHIGVRIGGTVPASPPIYQVSLQGMGSTGLPDGTILGGGSPASGTFDPSAWTTHSFHWIALDNPYTPTVGQEIMPVVEYSSGTISGSNRLNPVYAWGSFQASSRSNGQFTTNNWSSGSKTGKHGLALRTANARYGIVSIGAAPTAVLLGTTGHRDALKFTLPEFFSTLTCYGLRVACSPPGSGGFKMGIWNSAGTELKAESISLAKLINSTDSYIECIFSTPETISPGVAYYAGIERTEANTPGLVHVELSEANDQLAYPLGTAACRATWNGSAWTDNTTFRPLSLELLISDITGGGGGAAFQLVGGGGLVY